MASNENPYAAPRDGGQAIGINSGRREDLKSVAMYQKGILLCILAEIILFVLIFALPAGALVFQLLYFAAHITSIVFVFLLSMKVYKVATGILMGVLSMVPCFGLLILLLVNGKATGILTANGLKVGLLGANLSDI